MTKRIPTVWLLQQPRLRNVSIADAEQFGTLQTVLSARENPSIYPVPCLVQMMRAFQDYQDGDFLLYAPADPVVPLLAGIALAKLDKLNAPILWLRWDRDVIARAERREEAEREGKPINVHKKLPGVYIPVPINARGPVSAYIAKETNDK
jgi:hypothetical protein